MALADRAEGLLQNLCAEATETDVVAAATREPLPPAYVPPPSASAPGEGVAGGRPHPGLPRAAAGRGARDLPPADEPGRFLRPDRHDISLFPRLVLGCINADLGHQLVIFQH